MALFTGQITLAAAAKRVSDVYAGVVGADPGATKDVPYRQITFTAETNALQLGSSSAVSASVYGVPLAVGSPVTIGPFDAGPLKLSDYWAFGTGVLHILAIPF